MTYIFYLDNDLSKRETDLMNKKAWKIIVLSKLGEI